MVDVNEQVRRGRTLKRAEPVKQKPVQSSVKPNMSEMHVFIFTQHDYRDLPRVDAWPLLHFTLVGRRVGSTQRADGDGGVPSAGVPHKLQSALQVLAPQRVHRSPGVG